MTVYELVKKFESDARVSIDVIGNFELGYLGGIQRFLNEQEMIEKYGSFTVINWMVNRYGNLRIECK